MKNFVFSGRKLFSVEKSVSQFYTLKYWKFLIIDCCVGRSFECNDYACVERH